MTPAPAVEEPDVQDQAQETDPQFPYGENFEELPEQLVNAIRETIKSCQNEDKYLRRREIRRDWRARSYEAGFQHLCWQGGQNGGFSIITPGGIAPNTAGGYSQAPRYVDDCNLYKPYLRVQTSILTQNLPGIKFEPLRHDKAEDQEAAKAAEGYKDEFYRANNPKTLQMQIARMLGNSGRTVTWTRTEANVQKFGINPVTNQPRMMEISTVYGTIETKVPILAKSQEDALYCFIADDPDVKQAKYEYPDFKDKIKGGVSGLAENPYERLARLGVLQGSRSEFSTAEAYKHLVTRTRCWLRPQCFTDERFDAPLEETAEGSEAQTIGDRINELFPDGVMTTFIGDVYVGAKPESMDDAIVIGFPYEGDGLNRPGFMEPMIVMQDAFNDAWNTMREIWDVSWPSTWIDAGEDEFDAIVKQRADPYAIRQKKLNTVGGKLGDSFFREPNPELPATFVQFVEMIQGQLPQFILAAPPALFGGAMEDQKTASGYAQARAQAMGQQGLVWAQMQWMFARILKQAALLATKNPDHAEGIAIPGGAGPNAKIDLGKITKGQFGCYPDEDSSFPESTEAKRSQLTQLFTLLGPTPYGAQMLATPANAEEILQLEGFSELIIPEAEAWEKQQFEIEQLLRTDPIPPPIAEQQQADVQHAVASIGALKSGLPAPPYEPLPPRSTVPVNDWNYHGWEASACQNWLNSEDCRTEMANGNQRGVDNVVLHWRAHVLAAQTAPPLPGSVPLMPPPPPGLPPGGPRQLPPIPGASATM